MIWILFYYNSLPDMPEECRLFSSEIMHRDFFKCNPTNTGHYRYPKFESMSYDEGCHKREVNAFLAKKDPERYVVFYTRHTDTDRRKKNKVVGYFKVGRRFYSPKNGFYASETVLLPKAQCIEIDFASRGVPASWGKSSIKGKIERILRDLREDSSDNICSKYKSETRKIMKKLKNDAGRQEIITTCNKCGARGNCYWGRKENKIETLKELYVPKNLC